MYNITKYFIIVISNARYVYETKSKAYLHLATDVTKLCLGYEIGTILIEIGTKLA